jgi:UDP-N-acetyl-D-galactosamine dehydrogenase
VGFDINKIRIEQLCACHDSSCELTAKDIGAATQLHFTSKEAELLECNVLIVAVPTPINASRVPDLRSLIAASEIVGRTIRKGTVVVYESTVYPGATEEDCIPVVENISGLRYNVDFFAGYSPERVNPGDKDRPLKDIIKITSGSTPEVADFVDALYARIIKAGTFKARSIKIAEAAKIIENTQRDVNIALINELSIVFGQLGIDTDEALEAAGTKWNFIRMQPGLVGGHCIGADPYYLLHKSMAAGFIPNIIRTAREINDGMARHAVQRLVRTMVERGLAVNRAKVLIVGFTFKENCTDIRNTKVIDLVTDMHDWGMATEVVDTWADPTEVKKEYGLELGIALPEAGGYDALILAVAHQDLVAYGPERFRALLRPGGVLFDMKAVFSINESDLRL